MSELMEWLPAKETRRLYQVERRYRALVKAAKAVEKDHNRPEDCEVGCSMFGLRKVLEQP